MASQPGGVGTAKTDKTLRGHDDGSDPVKSAADSVVMGFSLLIHAVTKVNWRDFGSVHLNR